MSINEEIKKAEKETDINPTPSQIKAGNYRKGKVNIKGLLISIENPVGSIRRGVDQDGKEWQIKVKNTYGYFMGTDGNDGDQVDVFIGKDHDSDSVFIIDQVDPKTKKFDEHKVMLSFVNKKEAKQAYLSNYESGWKGFGSITEMEITDFKNWLKDKKSSRHPAKDFKNKKDPTICHIALIGEVEEDVTLSDLRSQIKDDFDVLVLEIRSQGGNVLEGMKIMQWLDELSQKGKYIITVVSANAYSIASMIMLAANKRYISKHGQVMVHNPMIPKIEYANANELEYQTIELRKLEGIMRELYSVFTGMKDEDIEMLMSKETYLSPEDSIKYGFADEIIDIEKKPYEMGMDEVKHKIKNMSKTLNILNRVIAYVNNSDIVNQEYGTMGGDIIEVYQEDPAQYSLGDRTNVETGEFKLVDGSTIKIEDFKITEIEKELVPDGADAQEGGVETDDGQIVSFTDLEKPVYYVVDGELSEAVVEGEIKLLSGETLIVKEGLLFDVKESNGDPEVEEPAAEFNEGEAPKIEEPKAEEVIKEEPVAEEDDKEVKMMDTIEEMKKTIESLQKKVTEMTSEKLQEQIKEISGSVTNIENKLKEVEKFESTAAKAIDELAKHTSSVFKPVAKSRQEAPPTGSIFQQMKERRGL